jgi:hypothetical protein
MFVCCECCVLSGSGLCDELITLPGESYRRWYVVVHDLETSRMRRPWPALGRSATDKKKSMNKTWIHFQWFWDYDSIPVTMTVFQSLWQYSSHYDSIPVTVDWGRRMFAIIRYWILSSSLLSKNLEIKTYRIVIPSSVLYGCRTWSLTLRQELRLKVCENRVLRKVFGPKQKEVTGSRKGYIPRTFINCNHHQILFQW